MKKQFVLCVSCLLVCCVYGTVSGDKVDVRNLHGYCFENALGEEVALDSLNYDYVFLELWSMSCKPCLREMEYFKELPTAYKGKSICFVAICIENNVALWKDFLTRKNIGGMQWITPILGKFQKENSFFAVPRFVLVDRKGNIVQDNAKRPSDPALRSDLDQLFASEFNYR